MTQLLKGCLTSADAALRQRNSAPSCYGAKMRRSMLITIVSILAAAAILSGCGDSNTSEDSGPENPAAATASTQEPATAPPTSAPDPFATARFAEATDTSTSGDSIKMRIAFGQPIRFSDVSNPNLGGCDMANDRTLLVPYQISMTAVSSMTIPNANFALRLRTDEPATTGVVWKTDNPGVYDGPCTGDLINRDFQNLQPNIPKVVKGYVFGLDFYSPNAPGGSTTSHPYLENSSHPGDWAGSAVCGSKIFVISC